MSEPFSVTEAPGSTTPGASALMHFMAVTNDAVSTLSRLAEELRQDEPGTAALITAFTETLAGRALDVVARWPS